MILLFYDPMKTDFPPFFHVVLYFCWVLTSFMGWDEINSIHTRNMFRTKLWYYADKRLYLGLKKNIWLLFPDRHQWKTLLLSSRWSHTVIRGVMNNITPKHILKNPAEQLNGWWSNVKCFVSVPQFPVEWII